MEGRDENSNKKRRLSVLNAFAKLYLTLKALVNKTQDSIFNLNFNTVCCCKVISVFEHRVLNGFDLYFWHLTQPADHEASQRLCLQANLKQILPAVHGPLSPHCSSTCFSLLTMPTSPEDKGQAKEAQHNSSPPAKVSFLTYRGVFWHLLETWDWNLFVYI